MKTSIVALITAVLAAPAEAVDEARELMFKSAKSSKSKSGKYIKDPKAHKDCGHITEAQVEDAQKAWGDGIVTIAAAYEAGGDYTHAAKEHIETLYGYDIGPVLFKPTLAAEQQFRSTFEGALSYFVATGHEAEDKGFAIKGWTDVRFENVDILTEGKVGQAMGNYFFTTPEGDEVKVEYSFGYILDDHCDVRINLHHSSLPYDPAPAVNESGGAITQDMIEEAQAEWGEGIVRIAAAYTAGEDYEKVAADHIETLYGYENPPILFKPTLAAEEQFRPTFEDALSYFVATGHIAEDTGFAIKGWTDVRFENAGGILTHGDVGMAMGNYFFTTPEGDEVKVEYSFGYLLDSDGDVRIHLHHSSMPYDPEA